MESTSKGRFALGTLAVVAAVAGFAVAVGPVFAGGVASRATTETGTGTTEAQATKVVVCHKAKVTIRVSSNAWPAHRRHGDTMSACTQDQLRKAKAANEQDEDEDEDGKGKAKGKSKAAKGNGKAKASGAT